MLIQIAHLLCIAGSDQALTSTMLRFSEKFFVGQERKSKAYAVVPKLGIEVHPSR